jgi:hypothetical protein
VLLFIYESSLTGVFKVLLIILCIYFIYNIFVRFFLPHLLRQSIKSFQNRFENNGTWQDQKGPVKKEGEITIEPVEKQSQNGNSSAGEYVDYEEVK